VLVFPNAVYRVIVVISDSLRAKYEVSCLIDSRQLAGLPRYGREDCPHMAHSTCMPSLDDRHAEIYDI